MGSPNSQVCGTSPTSCVLGRELSAVNSFLLFTAFEGTAVFLQACQMPGLDQGASGVKVLVVTGFKWRSLEHRSSCVSLVLWPSPQGSALLGTACLWWPRDWWGCTSGSQPAGVGLTVTSGLRPMQVHHRSLLCCP